MVKEKIHISWENVCRTKQFLPEELFIKSVLTWRIEPSRRASGLPDLILTLFLGTKISIYACQQNSAAVSKVRNMLKNKSKLCFQVYATCRLFFYFKLYLYKIKYNVLPVNWVYLTSTPTRGGVSSYWQKKKQRRRTFASWHQLVTSRLGRNGGRSWTGCFIVVELWCYITIWRVSLNS